MSEEIQTFRLCRNDLELGEVIAVLEEAGIEYVSKPNTGNFDLAAIGTELIIKEFL